MLGKGESRRGDDGARLFKDEHFAAPSDQDSSGIMKSRAYRTRADRCTASLHLPVYLDLAIQVCQYLLVSLSRALRSACFISTRLFEVHDH